MANKSRFKFIDSERGSYITTPIDVNVYADRYGSIFIDHFLFARTGNFNVASKCVDALVEATFTSINKVIDANSILDRVKKQNRAS